VSTELFPSIAVTSKGLHVTIPARLNRILRAMKVSEAASVVYWSEFLATERRCIVVLVRYELNLYVM
jgi:hypothetical protein